MTVWPATPLSPVVVERWRLLADDTGHLDWRTPVEPRELPPEWVLRQLADANLDDDSVLIALLEDYGAISWSYFDPAAIPPDRQSLLGHLPTADEQGTEWWINSQGTLEDARWWLKTARALAGIWREASLDGDPSSIWAAEGFPSAGERDCWARFTHALNVGLRPFRAHIEHVVPLPDGREVVHGLPRVGLYSAACRQVFNFVVREETARHCENETCGHAFVHQLGGATYRQHRSTGLRFCTPECARAEASRQYRRRKAARAKEQQP